LRFFISHRKFNDVLFLFAARGLLYSGLLYEVNVFKMSSKLSLVRDERCFVLFALMVKFLKKTKVISMRRHAPHSESQWATRCSVLLQNTHVTGYHMLPAFNHLHGAVSFFFAQIRYSDYTKDSSIPRSIPGQGQIFSSPNPPYRHWGITSLFFNG